MPLADGVAPESVVLVEVALLGVDPGMVTADGMPLADGVAPESVVLVD